MMQTLIQFLGKPIRKSVQWYLSKPREFKYQDISITVAPGVFHPGFFFSTSFILEFLGTQQLRRQKFLEVGSGSGIISIFAAKNGAEVTAIDINSKAVKNTRENSEKNAVKISILESDLFSNVPPASFDWIVINPPYYPIDPKSEAEYAWNCGEDHQYFKSLFAGLGKFITNKTNILIVLSDVCDLQTIFSIGSEHGFSFKKISERKVWADGQNYLYWIMPS